MTEPMKCQLLIRGGRVVDPANQRDALADVAIDDGRILAVGPELNGNGARQVLDADGCLVIPGVIDSHTHITRAHSQGVGYRMLVKAGVTTAVDFEGPVEWIVKNITTLGCSLNVAVLNVFRIETSSVSDTVARFLERGALGVKLLGGHYPLTPEITAAVIDSAFREAAYVAFHAGTTETGSHIQGMEEAFRLAAGRPLHIAHINAYCRGLIDDPLTELQQAMDLLKAHPRVVSESHLAPFNGCSGAIDLEGLPESHVTRNCLKARGYPVSEVGLQQAILDGEAAVFARVGGEIARLYRDEALSHWRELQTQVGVSFNVNLQASALVCASQKNDSGNFLVDAISSDGGAIPRNFILSHGLMLVAFGALTLPELVHKASYMPSQMFGFTGKGHLSTGADADVVVVDPVTGLVRQTIIQGEFAMINGVVLERSGRLLTTERGEAYLQRLGVPTARVDLNNSLFLKRTLLSPSR